MANLEPRGKTDNSDSVSDAFGADGHVVKDTNDGGEHHTVYNDVWHTSYDYDSDGNYVEGSHHDTEH